MRRHFRALVVGVMALVVAAGCGSPSTGAPAVTTGSAADASGQQTADPGTGTDSGETNPAGDIPDSQVFIDYTPAGGGYTVQVPQGWARTENGGSTTFADKYNSITIAPSAAAAAPTIASGQQDLAALVASSPSVTPGEVTMVQRAAGPAVRITYQADSAVDAVTGKTVRQDVEQYEFFAVGTVVAVTLSAPAGADNVDPWRTVTDSFRWTS